MGHAEYNLYAYHIVLRRLLQYGAGALEYDSSLSLEFEPELRIDWTLFSFPLRFFIDNTIIGYEDI